MTLNQLTAGQRARVVALGEDSEFIQHCQAFGLQPGAEVALLRKSFIGPLQIKVLDSLYAIRRSDAQAVQVEPY